MNIAIYHPWVYLKGGAERTLLELMLRSRHHWTLYTNHYDPECTFPEFRDVDVVELDRVSIRRTLWHAGLAAARVLTQSIPLAEDTAALMISSEGIGNLAVLRRKRVPVFCFCHTPLKVLYDPFTRERFLNHQQPGMALRSGLSFYAWVDRWAWSRYEHIFCNSYEVACRVLTAGLAPDELVEVLHPGVDLARFDPHGPREPFFLLAGRIARTKNIELGIDAFLRLEEKHPEIRNFKLLIAGMVDEKSQAYLAEMRVRAGGNPRIEFLIDPSDTLLGELYRRCYATLCTSLNEDWGIVVLEGMASGKPVLAVDRGGPTESVLPGQTGFLCSAEADSFAAAMGKLIRDPIVAAAMGVAARQHVAKFAWDGFVARMDQYVEVFAGEPATTRVPEAPRPSLVASGVSEPVLVSELIAPYPVDAPVSD